MRTDAMPSLRRRPSATSPQGHGSTVPPMNIFRSVLLLWFLGAIAAFAETRTETYKTIGDVKLDMTIQLPDGWKAEDKRPAIVFFFGGGWSGGSPTQFENQARYLASRGMVAMAA